MVVYSGMGIAGCDVGSDQPANITQDWTVCSGQDIMSLIAVQV